jgi:hypothetical protein
VQDENNENKACNALPAVLNNPFLIGGRRQQRIKTTPQVPQNASGSHFTRVIVVGGHSGGEGNNIKKTIVCIFVNGFLKKLRISHLSHESTQEKNWRPGGGAAAVAGGE